MLKQRFFTATVVIGALIAIMFVFPAWAHLLVLLALFALAQREFGGMIQRSGHSYDFVSTSVCGAAYIVLSAAESPALAMPFLDALCPAGLSPSGIVLVITPAILLTRGVLRRKTENAMETFAFSFAGFWYVAVLLAFIIRIIFGWEYKTAEGAANHTGHIALALFILLVKIGDVGAYFTGMRFGKHKLIPEISPKKTVEGLAGGYAFAIVFSLAAWGVARQSGGCLGDMRYPLHHALILPVLLTTTGVLGDLAESLVKRSVNVKDSGTHFPGMGGLLDILDSLLFSAPVAFLYFGYLKN